MTKYNLQDNFLNEARRKNIPITIYLVNGFQMRGTVQGFDSFTVALLSEGRQQLIYKHGLRCSNLLSRFGFKRRNAPDERT